MRLVVVLAIALGLPTGLLAQDVQKVLQRDFQARGQATMDRVVQDGLQRLCTDTNDRPPGDVARQLEADQMKSIAFPGGDQDPAKRPVEAALRSAQAPSCPGNEDVTERRWQSG